MRLHGRNVQVNYANGLYQCSARMSCTDLLSECSARVGSPQPAATDRAPRSSFGSSVTCRSSFLVRLLGDLSLFVPRSAPRWLVALRSPFVARCLASLRHSVALVFFHAPTSMPVAQEELMEREVEFAKRMEERNARGGGGAPTLPWVVL
eukprot:gene13041-biopygen12484